MKRAWDGGREGEPEGMSCSTEDKASCVALGASLHHPGGQFPYQLNADNDIPPLQDSC